MAKKSKSSASSSAAKELRSSLKKVRAELERAEARTDRWKAKAKKHAAASAATSKQLAKAERALAKVQHRSITKPPAATPTSTAVTPVVSDAPGDSWNVTRLRAAARAKGIMNYSRKTKDQLIAELKS
jgi:NADH dehydrogenase/NADH:ubiquinone oxidoreductase subunit G